MSRAVHSYPRRTGHSEEFSQNVVHWRRKWQPIPVFLPREPHEQYEKAKRYMTPEDEPLRLEGVQYATRGEWRAITNSSRKKEAAGPKQKQHSVVGMFGGEIKVRCYKEQYCIGTWNGRCMNQGKLDVVKLEMAGLNTDLLGISELKWMEMGELNSDDHYIYYCRQESLRRNGVVLIINKRRGSKALSKDKLAHKQRS